MHPHLALPARTLAGGEVCAWPLALLRVSVIFKVKGLLLERWPQQIPALGGPGAGPCLPTARPSVGRSHDLVGGSPV